MFLSLDRNKSSLYSRSTSWTVFSPVIRCKYCIICIDTQSFLNWNKNEYHIQNDIRITCQSKNAEEQKKIYCRNTRSILFARSKILEVTSIIKCTQERQGVQLTFLKHFSLRKHVRITYRRNEFVDVTVVIWIIFSKETSIAGRFLSIFDFDDLVPLFFFWELQPSHLRSIVFAPKRLIRTTCQYNRSITLFCLLQLDPLKTCIYL